MLFSRQFEVQKWKFEQNLKNLKSNMAAACVVIYLTIVAMETNAKFHVNRMNCVESRRRLTPPPTPSLPFRHG